MHVARHRFPAVQEELHTAHCQLRLQPIPEELGAQRLGEWTGRGPEARKDDCGSVIDDCGSVIERQMMGTAAEKEELRRIQELTETNGLLMLRIAELEATNREVGEFGACDS